MNSVSTFAAINWRRAGTEARFPWGESEAEAHHYANAYDVGARADSFAPEVELPMRFEWTLGAAAG